MSNQELICIIGTGTLTPLIAYCLLWSVKRQPRIEGDSRVLVYSTPLKVVGVIGMILAVGLCDPFLNSPRKDGLPNNIPANLTLWLVIFFLPAACVCFFGFLYRITFTAREIEVRTPWFSRRRILWEDVTGCEKKGGEFTTCYHFETRRDGKFKVYAMMNGVEGFLEEYSRQTGLLAPQHTRAEERALARRQRRL